VSSTALTPKSDPLCHGLDRWQSAAVISPARTLAILAGAGSGKTRVLTHRIARRIADESATPKHVLAVTFTNKAACEMKSRLRYLVGEEVFPRRRQPFTPQRSEGPAVHTFHALGCGILARYSADYNQPRRPITQRRSSLLADSVRAVGEQTLTTDALGTEIEWAKARALSPSDYLVAASDSERVVGVGGRLVDLDTVKRAFEAYEEIKRHRNVLDLDDLIVEALRVLDADPAFLAAQRFWYRHVFVDEYQDLNPAQFRLLRTLVGDANGPDLCVVGDPNQAIYGWNGADPHLLRDFTTYFPHAEVLRLETNYRCRRPIVTAAAPVLNLRVPPVRADAENGAVPTLWAFDDTEREADGVARAVQRSIERYGVGEVAVLAPTSKQLDPIALALLRRGIVTERAGSSLLKRPEVRIVLERMRRLGGARGGVPLLHLSYDIGDLCDRSARGLPLDDIDDYWDGLDDDGYPTVRGLPDDDPTFILNKAGLDNFVELLEEFQKALPWGDLDAFETWANAEMAKREAGLHGKGVALSSIHRAKGLEWSVVFLVGCVDGSLPNRRARTPSALAESRRLAYVALTRASDELFCTWSRTRVTPWGGVEETRPTPFFENLNQRDGSSGITSVQPEREAFDPGIARQALQNARRFLSAHSDSGSPQ